MTYMTILLIVSIWSGCNTKHKHDEDTADSYIYHYYYRISKLFLKKAIFSQCKALIASGTWHLVKKDKNCPFDSCIIYNL